MPFVIAIEVNNLNVVTLKMDDRENVEKKYLINSYLVLNPHINPFELSVGNGKRGYFYFPYPSDNPYVKHMEQLTNYQNVYDSIMDLVNYINLSLHNAIELVYSEAVLNSFDFMIISTEEEWQAFYYIENALFRIESLWDMLAQIVNLKYELEKNKRRVYHSKVFDISLKSKYWKNDIPEEIKKINEYITEVDDTDCEGCWKGNYKYVSNLRNCMTHNYSIARSSASGYAFEFRHHPSYILKRVVEDYSKVQHFIIDECTHILDDLQKEKEHNIVFLESDEDMS